MPFSNCKVELKFKWTKRCLLSAAGNNNDNDNDNNDNGKKVIFDIKDTKLFICCNFISKRQSKAIKIS